MENFDQKDASPAASLAFHEKFLDDWFGSKPGRDTALHLELAKAQVAPRVVDIKDVHWAIGVWHQKQYENFGVQRLLLSPDKITMELKKPVDVSELFTTIGFDKSFSFNYRCTGSDWSFSNVSGLRLDGDTVHGISTHGNEIEFYSVNGRKHYGSALSNYIRALFEPLMSCIPHK